MVSDAGGDFTRRRRHFSSVLTFVLACLHFVFHFLECGVSLLPLRLVSSSISGGSVRRRRLRRLCLVSLRLSLFVSLLLPPRFLLGSLFGFVDEPLMPVKPARRRCLSSPPPRTVTSLPHGKIHLRNTPGGALNQGSSRPSWGIDLKRYRLPMLSSTFVMMSILPKGIIFALGSRSRKLWAPKSSVKIEWSSPWSPWPYLNRFGRISLPAALCTRVDLPDDSTMLVVSWPKTSVWVGQNSSRRISTPASSCLIVVNPNYLPDLLSCARF